MIKSVYFLTLWILHPTNEQNALGSIVSNQEHKRAVRMEFNTLGNQHKRACCCRRFGSLFVDIHERLVNHGVNG
jgi:hypothetical protein